MTAEAILSRLVALFPDFSDVWRSPDNCFREDDGSFTCCGVWAEFSHFFRDRYEQLPTEQVAELGRFVGECVSSHPSDDAATCFLENVAAERFHLDFRQLLSGEALRFYSIWDKAV